MCNNLFFLLRELFGMLKGRSKIPVDRSFALHLESNQRKSWSYKKADTESTRVVVLRSSAMTKCVLLGGVEQGFFKNAQRVFRLINVSHPVLNTTEETVTECYSNPKQWWFYVLLSFKTRGKHCQPKLLRAPHWRYLNSGWTGLEPP